MACHTRAGFLEDHFSQLAAIVQGKPIDLEGIVRPVSHEEPKLREGGWHLSEETRRKMSEAQRRRFARA